LLELKHIELKKAEKQMYKCKFDEALKTIIDFEKKDKIKRIDQLKGLILKGKIYIEKEQYKEAVKIGEQAYNISQKLRVVSESIDALIIKAYVVFLGESDVAYNCVLEIEKLIESSNNEESTNFSRQKADFLLIKSKVYFYKDDLNKALVFAKKCLKLQEELGEKLEISRVKWLIGDIYLLKSNFVKSLDYVKNSLVLHEELANPVGIADCFSLQASIFADKGDLDQAIQFCKQSLAISEISISTKLDTLHILGTVYKLKGELNRTIRYYKRAAKLAKIEGYTGKLLAHLMGIGSTYRMKGEHKRASKILKRSLLLSNNINSIWGKQASLFYLILIELDQDSHEQAVSYLSKLDDIANQTKTELFQHADLIARALVLKKSNRIRNRTEAETLLKIVIKAEVSPPILYLISLINLCELYLEELQITNNPEVLNDLTPLINQLLIVTEKQRSYLLVAETKLLQAKLALIQMDISKAKLLLTQAQRIAELHGLTLLAIKISNEHDNFLEQINIWENLKNTNAPMSERIKLASFDSVFERMEGKRSVDSLELTHEIPVLLLIIGSGGFTLFSNNFSKKWVFKDDIISGFLTAFSDFSEELFSKKLDRAKFGEHMILIETVENLSICYIFKGTTFLAKKKLSKFTERIQNTTYLWDTLYSYYKTNRVIELKNHPELESLITEIFIN
jgi:tetratricopeptide (TPR) repeat protein